MTFFTDFLARFGLTVQVLAILKANQNKAFSGMDISEYPGADFLRYLHDKTNVVWAGAYLDSPRPIAILKRIMADDGKLGVRGGGAATNVSINISTPDVKGFKASQSQIAAMMAQALQRGQRNR